MKKRWGPLLLSSTILLIATGCSAETEKETFQPDEEGTETTLEENAPLALPQHLLQKGDQNEDVLALQQALQKIGYPVEASGTYDALTTWAITDIQLQHEDLLASGVYDREVKEKIEQGLDDATHIAVANELEKPAYPDEFVEIVENPYDILVLVNKNYALPDDYEPTDLVVPDVRFPFDEDDPKKQLRKEAADALEELFSNADEAGIALFAQPGYRSYDRQEAIFASNVDQHGEEHANTYSARAGESEHQTGLVMDVTSEKIGFDLTTEFGETDEGKWIKEHAHDYGFIIRYPEGKENITQYQYEPWHLRYVGKRAAKEITENNLTLEEYLGAD